MSKRKQFLGEFGPVAAAPVEEDGCVGVRALGEVNVWFWEVCIHDVGLYLETDVMLLMKVEMMWCGRHEGRTCGVWREEVVHSHIH